jgi:hypothetical protein
VKDEAAFLEWAGQYELEIIRGKDGIGFIGNDGDGAGWPNQIYDEKTGDWNEVDFHKDLSKHLTEDSVAITMEAGAEKARYIVGCAVAVNSKGEIKVVNLIDIYDLAKGLTNKPEEITQAEY